MHGRNLALRVNGTRPLGFVKQNTCKMVCIHVQSHIYDNDEEE